MAQTGYTPILLYSSSTGGNAPAAGNLTNSTLGSELAINITDGKLFYKDNANVIQVIGWKVTPTTAGGTGLTSYSQGDLLYYNAGTTLTALAKNTSATRYLSNTGSSNNPAWAQVDLTNGVTGDLPYSNLAQGSALSVLGVTGNATADVASIAAGTDHQVLRRSGTSLAFGAVALNQSAAITGTLPVGNGGTGTATAFTAGSVVFAGASGVYSQNNANLFWDNSNTALGIGINTPASWGRLAVYDGTILWAVNPFTPGLTCYMGTSSSHALALTTANAEVMRLFTSKGVSINNTTDPGAGGLYATGNGSFGLTGTGGRLSVRGETSDSTKYTLFTEAQDGTDQLGVRCDGAVYMGLDGASPYNLTTGDAANAVLRSDGFFYRSTSSIKYKQNVQDATHGLAEVMALRPVTYEGKSSVDAGKVFGGLIAEEVHDAGLTEFVQYAEDGSPDALSYGNMVSLLVKAIQELNAKIELQSIEIAKLKGN